MQTPCSWPVDRTGFPPLPELSDTPTTEEQAAFDAALDKQLAMEDLAVNVLWALSGRQFGICEVTVRPMPIEHQPGTIGSGLTRTWPYRVNLSKVIIDSWSGLFGGTGSKLNGPTMVTLPGPAQPNTVKTPVTVELGECDCGESRILDPSEYDLTDGVLYRRDGKPWPYQDLSRPMGEACTWSVTYWKGLRPPRHAGRLVGLLALEFLLAANGDGRCRLPKSVSRVQRQGVSYDVDPTPLYAAGKTGVPEIDTWLAAVNPNHLMQAPSVL